MLCPGRSGAHAPTAASGRALTARMNSRVWVVALLVWEMSGLCTRCCVCQGRVPAGQQCSGAGGVGCRVVVAPREAQAMPVTGAVRQGTGMGLDCREMSSGLRSSKLGASSPALEKSFAFASQLCAQCCGNVNRFAVFPEVLLLVCACCFLCNKLLEGEKKTK